MNIDVRIEPHERQTYETCGDYWWQFVRGLDGVDLETLEVRVSALGLLGRHLGMFRDRVEHVLSTRLVIVEEIVDGNADPAGATPPPPG